MHFDNYILIYLRHKHEPYNKLFDLFFCTFQKNLDTFQINLVFGLEFLFIVKFILFYKEELYLISLTTQTFISSFIDVYIDLS